MPARNAVAVVGYWHNWKGKATEYIPLREVPPIYNQVVVAFALPAGGGKMTFSPSKQTPEEFRRDIRFLQARGTRVLISIGGGNHPIRLRTREEKRVFVGSLSAIIDTYGFNGVDINLEGDSLELAPGDLDYRHPKTPHVLYFIQAMRDVKARYGQRLMLTASPETQFLVGGHKRYGGKFGGYLPVLHALRDHLDLVHMQYYNSGTQLVYEGRRRTDREMIVKVGTPDFLVALTEMLILGFPVAQNPQLYFPGLGAEKIAIGLPATPSAANGGGYLRPEELRAALRYLVTGHRTYKSTYHLRQRGGHPNLAGLMTWSINWDASRDGGTKPYAFAKEAAALWGIPPAP